MKHHRSFLSSAFLLALSVTACSVASPEGTSDDGTLGAAQSAAGVGGLGGVGGVGPVVGGGGLVLDPVDPTQPGPFVPNGPVKPHSFLAPATWANGMVYNDGWTDKYPRQLADMNGDGKKDVVGFGKDGVWIARSTGTGFDPRYVLADFGEAQSWTTARHERLVGDISGDGRDDIVGFGDAGVYITTTTATAFTPVSFVIADFGYTSGWRVDLHARLLADIDGDGKQDIVAYGNDGVWIARSTGTGFAPPAYVLARFGNNAGFNNTRHIRTAADVNGDGKADLVVFADDGVYTALSTGSGFATPTKVVNGLGYNDGWTTANHPRFLVDVNRDGRKDIVAFGNDGVWIARSNGAGFASPTYEVAQFGVSQGWGGGQKSRPRFVGDFNGDGYVDIVGSGPSSVFRSLGNATGFAPAESILNDFSGRESLGGYSKPVMAGDVDGDGKVDLIAFDTMQIKVARSTEVAPPAPPAAPSNLRATSVGSSSLTLNWNDNSTNEIRFFVTHRTPTSSYGGRTVAANTTSMSSSGLSPSTQQCFTVTAEGQFNSSPPSPEFCVSTMASTGGGGGGGGSDPLVQNKCGTGLSVCPVGYHEEEFFYSSSCPGTSSNIDNTTKCVKDSNVFTACGINVCPTGHHPVGFVFQTQCDQSSSIPSTADNATTCQANSQSFTSCGGCPAGYSAQQTFSSAACTPYNTFTCNKL